MTKPTVSVAMCTHNGATHVLEQLESIAKQEHLPDELVICDDCSSDETVDIVRRFADTAPFTVNLHVNPTNIGFPANQAKSVRLTTGDLIFPADHDDVWYPTKVGQMVKPFLRDPQVGLVLCDADIVNEDLTPRGYRAWERVNFNKRYQDIFSGGRGFEVLLRHSFVANPTMGFRAEFKDLIIPTAAGWFPDAWAALLISGVSETRIVPEPLYQYRQIRTQMLGLPKKSPIRKFREAKRAVDRDHFLEIVRQHRDARARLLDFAPTLTGSSILAMLDAKITLALARAGMRKSVFHRYPLIIKELLLGRYHRYAHGWKTALLDLMI